jgi:RND family efflux transporter MFP subunit
MVVTGLFLAASMAILPAATQAQGQQAMAVRVDAVRSTLLSQKVPVLGRLVPRQAGVVAARTSGAIERFVVEVGDRLNAGDPIAHLDEERLKAIRDDAAAALDNAKANLQVRDAELNLERQNLKRIEGLKGSSAFSGARFEDQLQTVNAATARITVAKALVNRAQSALTLAEIDLRYTTVAAPYDGVVTQRLTETGAFVSLGDPVVRMIADSDLEVEADVPANRLAGLTPGSTVEITLDSGTHRYTARVRAIVPSENPLTRTRPVRFVPDLSGNGANLAAEQSVTVLVPVSAPREVMTVHKDAILRRGDGTTVFVIVDGKAEVREVTLGEASGARFEVISGLEDGEQAVIRGNERLRPGQEVQVLNGQAAPADSTPSSQPKQEPQG